MQRMRPQGTLLLLLVSCVAGYSQVPAQASAAENGYMEAQADSMGLKSDLHSLERSPDGSRGFGIGGSSGHYYSTQPHIVVLKPDGTIDTARSSPFHSMKDADFHGFYCRKDALAVGQVLSSATQITASGRLIYTKTRFSVTQMIKPGLEVRLDADLTILTIGGTVIDNTGERFTVAIADGVPFAQGQYYLLALERASALAGDEFLLSPKEAILVDEDSVYPLGISVKPFLNPAESLTQLARRWEQVTAHVPCPRT